MKIVTSQVLISKYGQSVLNLVKRLGTDIQIMPNNNCYAAKAYIDTVNDDILIFGGPDVIDFFTLMNPSSDPDQTISSDAPYACTKDPSNLVPDRSVGRIPDEQSNWSIDYIDKVTANQKDLLINKSSNSAWFNIVASVWQNISNFMNITFNMNNQNVVPPVTWNNVSPILGRKFSYLNLHGSAQSEKYFGQQGGIYPIALAPRLGDFENCFVITEACYGGILINRNKNMSIPLMALYSKSLGVVCSNCVNYGPASAPPRASDLLSLKLYTHIIAGLSLGEAFKQAKIDFITETIKNEGSLDPENKKTALAYNLYGNPSLVI